MSNMRIGSREHKELLCRFFTQSFTRFNPEDVRWPELSAETISRLKSLPVWEEAVKTEASTALMVQSYGRMVRDESFKEAISMNGFEESRHAQMLAALTRRYGIHVPTFHPEPPDDAEWAFLKVGYGECFDSFFGFGLFALARDSGFFPPKLVEVFEPIMQEEARHIIFHANWVAYTKTEKTTMAQIAFSFRQALALWVQSASRVKTALRIKNTNPQDNFTMTAHSSFGDFNARQFIEICLRENERRLAPYDPRLLRPTAVPAIARTMLAVLPKVAKPEEEACSTPQS